MKKIINSVNEKLESLILKYKDSIDEANNKIVGELNAQLLFMIIKMVY